MSQQILGFVALPALRYTIERRPKAGGQWAEQSSWGADLDGALRFARYWSVKTRRAFDWRVCVRCGESRSVLLGEGAESVTHHVNGDLYG
ncbi:hypothetical protein EA656_02530 [Pseudoxanthomonas winnipegensis]|uniref:Uncharacterized protein n=1 Tax=Pseudoxanthomonas winnipegensis TaxID=2480810 RepID=A0A4Q8LY96_9GAMM|nr:hypothetical protein [Pseudoxanthomonas winnipegensis]TAA37563.1 hypothetical protein EA656_02530 [Pseudoxanthomonas winnipegensis]